MRRLADLHGAVRAAVLECARGRTGLTNAKTEGYNRLVKQVKRVACGFRNTKNCRRRIRFHCTRAQRTSTRSTTAQLPG